MHRDTAAAAAAEADSTTTQNENQVDSTFQESLQNLQKALGLDQLDSDVDRELEDEELANLFEHAKRLAENSRKQAAENLAKEANEENKKLKEHRKSQNPKKALGLDHLESERVDQEIEDDELSHIFKHAKRVAENSRSQAAQDLAKQANEEHNTAHNQAHAEHLKTHFEQHKKEVSWMILMWMTLDWMILPWIMRHHLRKRTTVTQIAVGIMSDIMYNCTYL